MIFKTFTEKTGKKKDEDKKWWKAQQILLYFKIG